MKDNQIERPQDIKIGSWVRYANYLENELKKSNDKIDKIVL